MTRPPPRRAPSAAVSLIALSLAFGASAASASPAAPASPQAQAEDAQTGLRLARALRAAGDARSAVPVYQQIVDRKGSDPALKVELGETMLDADMVDDAIGVLGAIPANSPQGGRAELGLARAWLKLNQLDKALQHASRAAVLSPNDEQVLIGRGVILDRMNRHVEAQVSYRLALAKSPRSVAARSDLALSLALTHQFDQALEILEPIARSANATPRDRQNLAFIYGLKGDKAQALSISRADLDEATAQANARFFDQERAAGR